MFVTVRPASLHCCPFSFHSAVHHPYIPTYSLQWYEDLLSTNTDPSLGRISDTPPSWGESMWSKNIHFPCMRGGGRGGDPSFLNTTQRISVENSAQIFTTWLRTAAKDYNCCHSLYPRHFQALMKENRCPGGETISATVFWFKTHNKCLGKTLEKECVWRAGRTAENQTLPSTSWIHTHTHTETGYKPQAQSKHNKPSCSQGEQESRPSFYLTLRRGTPAYRDKLLHSSDTQSGGGKRMPGNPADSLITVWHLLLQDPEGARELYSQRAEQKWAPGSFSRGAAGISTIINITFFKGKQEEFQLLWSCRKKSE